MGFEKYLPGGLPLSIQRRFDAVFFEDVSDSLIGDLMAQVGECSLDAIVSPGDVAD